MKHIFIVNPAASTKDATPMVKEQLQSLPPSVDSEIYCTQAPGDATAFVDQWCNDHPETPVCFYACGGDGTLNEVVSGIVHHPQANLSCYPSGSGNDYVKYYRSIGLERNDFLDLNRLTQGVTHEVDLLKITHNDTDKVYYSLNICNFGFDAKVAYTMNHIKKKPIIGGRNAYTSGIIEALFTARRNNVRIIADGKEFHNGPMLLCTLANGQYVGGGYRCAPLSKNDDGLIDLNLIQCVSTLQLARVIGPYKKGTYLTHPYAQKIHSSIQCQQVEVSNSQPFFLCIDGEILTGKSFTIEILPHQIRFVTPIPNSR